MKKRFLVIFVVIVLGFLANKNVAQSYYITTTVTDTIPINLENKYSISSVNIIPFTELIILRDKALKRTEYNISYEKSSFSLADSLAYSIFDTITISYKSLKLGIKKNYKRREMVIKYDSKLSDTIKVFKTESQFLSSESIFGKGIEKSGTLIRGFSVGTTRDFTVSSGLRLQLSGKLSEDIEVVAAVTDENSPIQPEGNTERLEELDKVFIQIKHPNAVGTFGDYDISERIGEFGGIDRKLQGLKADLNFDNFSSSVSVAGSRGKFNSNQFNGTDGLQGPYRLSGLNNERDIIIIAGSEKIYIDGELLTRGENNDYVIEYGNAEITFTPRKLITSATRITVDFEYTDRQFSRNFFNTNIKSKLFNDRLNIKFNYFREGDNEDSPIDILLSEEDIKLLEDAGDDRFKASRSGVSLAAQDSTGRRIGTYSKIDTTINGESFSIYRYSPGDATAIYNIKFSFFGNGIGDYVRESLGNYRFVGKNQGQYLPERLLPLPQLKQTANILIDSEPFKNVNLGIELAGSDWDKNRFSQLDKNDDKGYARSIKLNIKPMDVVIGNLSFGKIGLSARDRFVEDRFTTLDRFNDVEFNRDYNISENLNENEELREFGLQLIPFEQLSVNSKYGFLKKGSSLKSKRFVSNLSLVKNESYNLKYNFDFVDTKRRTINGTWLKQKGDASYKFGKVKPGIYFLSELKKDKGINSDSIFSTSQEFIEIAPYLEIANLYGFSFKNSYSIREESFPIAGKLEKESKAASFTSQISYKGIREVSSSFDITYRNKKFTDVFQKMGLTDNETILVKSQSRLNFWQKFISSDLFYEAATKASSRLEKVYIKVPTGEGTHIFLGDLNNNGIADEVEFQQVISDGDFIETTLPTDKLFPVIELKASTRWKVEFKKIFKSGNDFLSTILKPVSTETFMRVEENNTTEETHKIYLLQFSNFLDETNTIRGSNLFQQDVHLFRNKSDFSIRLRFIERNNLGKFTSGIERGYFKQRSARIKFKMIKEVSNQTEIVSENDNVSAPENTNRARLVTSNSLSTDFSYRPIRNLEVGFKFVVGRIEDNQPATPTIIDNNIQTVRVNLSFQGKGRLRAEAERGEFNANTSDNIIPFEVTRGKSLGKNFTWRLSFDYRLAGNFQTTVSYDGRKFGQSNVIHTMKAEARAYF